ncbi:MAG TPA: DUF1616 domain-containing protein [Halococcus sp.]|nr:DUF1616 domain-containing protein [Halococcus sp.]
MSRDSLPGDDATADRYADSASSLRGLPGDLIVLIIYTVVVGGFIVVGDLSSILRFVIGIPFLLFVPGYAVLAALFPGRPSRNAGQVSSLSGMSRRFTSMRSIQQRGVRWGERVALSFGLSLFIIPILALILDLTPFPFRTGPIVTVLVLFSLLFALGGVVRRLRLSRAERFAVPVGYWAEDFLDGITDSPVDALLNIVLILAILVATASMTYALAVPKDAASYTGFSVGTQNNGQFTVHDYPDSFTVGEPQPLTARIENHERQPMDYTVVIQLQRTSDTGEVLARDKLDQFSTPTIPENRTWQRQHTVTPTIAEDNLQLTYLLYKGDVPQNPTERNAYRSIHLTIDVSGGGGGGGRGGGGGGG